METIVITLAFALGIFILYWMYKHPLTTTNKKKNIPRYYFTNRYDKTEKSKRRNSHNYTNTELQSMGYYPACTTDNVYSDNAGLSSTETTSTDFGGFGNGDFSGSGAGGSWSDSSYSDGGVDGD